MVAHNAKPERIERKEQKLPYTPTPISNRTHTQGSAGAASSADVQKPAISLVPRLLREIADDIERAATEPENPKNRKSLFDFVQSWRSADEENMAHQIASELSITLSKYLANGQTTLAFESVGIIEEPEGQIEDVLAQAFEKASADPRNGIVSTAPRMHLKLLGTPEITLDGVRVKALERCNRASLIIYILALHPKGLSAERLASYIMSDSADTDPFDTDASMKLSTVRTFIWRLRKIARWQDIVVFSGEQSGQHNRYKLPDNTTCDLWEFESKLDQAARLAIPAIHDEAASERSARLRQEAILLYRDEFCKGIGAGSIAHAAGYLRHRYLQTIMLQATFWKEKANYLRKMHRYGSMGTPGIEEEKAWLEALSNYRLAVHIEPYNEAGYEGVRLCQANLKLIKRKAS